jgi:hypothetical protein
MLHALDVAAAGGFMFLRTPFVAELSFFLCIDFTHADSTQRLFFAQST